VHDLLLRRVDLAGVDGHELVYGTHWLRNRATFLRERRHHGLAHAVDGLALLLDEEVHERRTNAINAPFRNVHFGTRIQNEGSGPGRARHGT